MRDFIYDGENVPDFCKGIFDQLVKEFPEYKVWGRWENYDRWLTAAVINYDCEEHYEVPVLRGSKKRNQLLTDGEIEGRASNFVQKKVIKMEYFIGVLLALVQSIVGAQVLVCSVDVRDRSMCESIRGLCEQIYKLDQQKQIVFKSANNSFSPMKTRTWTELRIEAVNENTGSAMENDGSTIYKSSRVVVFDRTLGSFLEFDEYRDQSGSVMDSSTISKIIKEKNLGFFGPALDRNRQTGVCRVQERAF